MSLIIITERFLAFHCCHLYERFNSAKVARAFLIGASFLSLVVHSWAPWLQRRVVRLSSQAAIDRNISPVYTWYRREDFDKQTIFAIKDYYNVMLR